MLVATSHLLLTTPGRCDFEDLGAGARAVGMGGAFCALGDDAFGFYYNPASLGFLRRGQLGTDYSKLWLGLDDQSDLSLSFVAVAMPFFKLQKIEASAEDSDTVNVSSAPTVDKSTDTAATRFKTKRVHVASIALGWRSFSLLGNYQESSYYLGFGRSIKDRFSYGFNLKALQEKYVIDKYLERSPVFNYGKKDSVSAFSVDAGAIYNLLPRLFLGVSLTDINQPDLGLMAKDQLPMTGRLGVAWKQKDIKWAADCLYRSGLWYGAFGMEKWVADLFAVRGGMTVGGLSYVHPSLGFSFDIKGIQIDYAFQYPLSGIKDVGGTHRMSFVFKFGSLAKNEVEPGSLEYYYSELQEKSKNLESNLRATEAEKRRLEEVLIEEATMRIRDRIKAAKSDAREGKEAPAAAAPAAKESRDMRHTVKRGETLQSIAEKYYGDSKYWNEIYQINRDNIGRGGSLKPGQVLLIPLSSRGDKASDNQSEQKKVAPQVIQPVEVTPVKVITTQQPAAQPAGLALPGMQGGQNIIQGGGEVIPIRVIAPEKPAEAAAKETPKEEPKGAKKPAAASGQPKNPASQGPRKHIVKSGENLRTIAEKYYNDSGRWRDIYKANTSKIVGGQVTPGQEIIIP